MHMSLRENISAELKSAMKARDSVKINTLRMLLAQIKDLEIAEQRALTEEDELAVLTNAAKKRKEAIALYEQSDRTDLLEREQAELQIIASYLPRQLTRDEIEAAIADVISELNASTPSDLGKVMGAAMKRLKGKADGKLVQEIVRAKLG